MGRISSVWVVMGGLVAGTVLLASSLLVSWLIVNDVVSTTFGELGVQRPAGARVFGYALVHYAAGTVAVWLYAVMRVRYGPGASTAIRAGLAAWIFVGVIPAWFDLALGLSGAAVVRTSMVTLSALMYPLATLAGAWVYREPIGDRASTAAPVRY